MFNLKVVFLLGLLGLLVMGSQAGELGVINGTTALPNSLPYQIFLKFKDSVEEWNCGGSLISQNYVLTAGYCTLERDGVNKTVTIYLGAQDLSQPSEENRIEMVSTDIITHENLKNKQRGTDNIGLVKLPEPITFTPAIQPIILGSIGQIDDVDTLTAQISGWGSTDMLYYSDPSVLHVGEIDILEWEPCADWPIFDKNTMFCGSSNNVSYTGICDSDIGGPLVIDDTQVGILLYSDPICDVINSFQMLLNVSAYFGWIQEHSDVINSNIQQIV